MTIKPETYRMVLGGDYKHWTRDPRIRGPTVLRAISATCLTHNYVLHVVAICTPKTLFIADNAIL